MEFDAQSDAARAIAGALGWWAEAGVDLDYAEAAQSWLAAPEPEAPPTPAEQVRIPPAPAPAPVERMGGDLQSLPQDLAAFAMWWLEEPSLDAGQVHGRVPPRGPRGAALMVLVEHPEAADSEALLTGPEGALLESALSAMGVAAQDCYFASALPRHMPMPDWQALGTAGLGAILRHHIALAAPQRLLVLGTNVLSLFDHDPAKSAELLRIFYHEDASVPALAERGLSTLIARPRTKARFWQRWLEWTGNETG